MTSASERIGAAVPELAPTGFFDPKISFTRGLYNRLTGQATNRILDNLAKNMDNPQRMAEIMKDPETLVMIKRGLEDVAEGRLVSQEELDAEYRAKHPPGGGPPYRFNSSHR